MEDRPALDPQKLRARVARPSTAGPSSVFCLALEPRAWVRFSPSRSFATRFILSTQSPVRVAGLMRVRPTSSPVRASGA